MNRPKDISVMDWKLICIKNCKTDIEVFCIDNKLSYRSIMNTQIRKPPLPSFRRKMAAYLIDLGYKPSTIMQATGVCECTLRYWRQEKRRDYKARRHQNAKQS